MAKLSVFAPSKKWLVVASLALAITLLIFRYSTDPVPPPFERHQLVDLELESSRIRGELPPKNAARVPRKHGYVYYRNSGGQQTAGMRALMSLQCFASTFGLPVHIVEPFTENSDLMIEPRNFEEMQQKEYLTLGDLVDITHFNEESKKGGYPILDSAKEFLKNAPRKKIYLEIEPVNCKKNDDKIDFLPKSCRKTEVENENISAEYNFQVVRTACIKCCKHNSSTPLIEADRIINHIYQQYQPNEVTLEVNFWTGKLFIPSTTMEDPMHCSEDSRIRQEIIIPSSRLLFDAKNYLSQYTSSNFVITIMLRFELFFSKNPMENIQKCVDTVRTEVKEIRQKQLNSSLVVTADVGESKSYKQIYEQFQANNVYNDVMDASTAFITELYEHKWTIKQWKDSFRKISTSPDKGYIATMERTIAGKSSCLILFGGGTFQEQALLDYVKNHPDPSEWCIRFICPHTDYSAQNLQRITHNLISLQ